MWDVKRFREDDGYWTWFKRGKSVTYGLNNVLIFVLANLLLNIFFRERYCGRN
jgi:hypothetical protein